MSVYQSTPGTRSPISSSPQVLARDLQFPPGIDPSARDLIERMVVQDADARLGAADLEELGGQLEDGLHVGYSLV